MPQTKQRQTIELNRRSVAIGALIVVVFAAGAIAVVTALGGSSVSKGDTSPPVPTPPGPETAERSAAADLLANKSFEDMTPEERDLVKSEATRAFDNAQFRVSGSGDTLATDVFRINGVTRVSRIYKKTKLPGGAVDLAEATNFYCDDKQGGIATYSYTKTALDTKAGTATLQRAGLPFNTTMVLLSWTDLHDLGFQTIDGHRVHGVEMPFRFIGADHDVPVRSWFDVDTARLIRREEPDRNTVYTFDWRQPAPVVIPPDRQRPACADAFYRLVPSARPTTEPAPPPAATAAATPDATAAQ